MTNFQKWLLALGLGFLGGAITAATDAGAGLMDYVRHGLIGMGPAVAALRLTLDSEFKADSAISGK